MRLFLPPWSMSAGYANIRRWAGGTAGNTKHFPSRRRGRGRRRRRVRPFVNITADIVETTAAEQKLALPESARVTFLPLLGGFVGADTAAVILTLPEDDRKYLMIDLGTNGEIAVGNSSGYQTSSTACGPALEGGNIECGMRGTEGAIEKVVISEENGV